MRNYILLLLLYGHVSYGADNYIVCNFPVPESIRLEMPMEHINWDIENYGDGSLGIEVEISPEIDGASFHTALVSKFENNNFSYGYSIKPDSLSNEIQKVKFSFLASEEELRLLELIFIYDNEPNSTCFKDPAYVYKAKAS